MSDMTRSRFYMWRTIFAMAHADNTVTEEEKTFMRKALEEQPFNAEQRTTLERDMEKPQDIAAMFAGITDQDDRSRFFYFARMLMWCDGDFARQEQMILTELERAHASSADITAIDTSAIHLEDEWMDWLDADMRSERGNIWIDFIRRFGS